MASQTIPWSRITFKPTTLAGLGISTTDPHLTNAGATSTPGAPGPPGPAGPAGPAGAAGATGATGAASTVPGPPNTLEIGTVTSGPAAATITGTSPNQTLNLVLQTGATGAQGIQGTQGIQGIQGPIGPTGPAGTTSWTGITDKPTTISGYGITDPIVLTSGSYANPSWITSLSNAKITGLSTVATTGAYNDLTGKPALATVATTGAYGDLTGKPTLGTAAANNTGDFATALQGTHADTALNTLIASNFVAGNGAVGTGTDAIAIGHNASALTVVNSGIAIGPSSYLGTGGYADSIAIGRGAQCGSNRSVELGTGLNSTSDTIAFQGITLCSKVGAILKHNGDGSLLTNLAWANITGAPTFATVATTGAYNDLTGKPTLGTASANNTGDFATAAQGTKADNTASALAGTSLALGFSAFTTTNSIAIGSGSGCNGSSPNSVAIGYNARTGVGTDAVAIGGTGANAYAARCVELGTGTNNTADSIAYQGIVLAQKSGSAIQFLGDGSLLSGLTNTQISGLGTASTHPSTDFATAAQGTLAGTALQPGAAIPWSTLTSVPSLVNSIIAGSNITITPVGGTGNVTINASATSSTAWSAITGTPTTLAGYGITDPVVLTSGSYANPSWITSLDNGKITGLGTAALQPSTAFATAAQGTLASTALQSLPFSYSGNGTDAMALGYSLPALYTGNVSIGQSVVIGSSGTNNVVIGPASQSAAIDGVAIGHNAKCGQYGLALGSGAVNTAASLCTCMGYSALCGSGCGNSLALGYGANVQSSSTQGVAIGYFSAITNSVDGVAIGNTAKCQNAARAVAFGTGTNTTADSMAYQGIVFVTKVGAALKLSGDGSLLTGVPPDSWANITGKPTTIAGFGITDSLVNTIVAGTNVTVSGASGNVTVNAVPAAGSITKSMLAANCVDASKLEANIAAGTVYGRGSFGIGPAENATIDNVIGNIPGQTSGQVLKSLGLGSSATFDDILNILPSGFRVQSVVAQTSTRLTVSGATNIIDNTVTGSVGNNINYGTSIMSVNFTPKFANSTYRVTGTVFFLGNTTTTVLPYAIIDWVGIGDTAHFRRFHTGDNLAANNWTWNNFTFEIPSFNWTPFGGITFQLFVASSATQGLLVNALTGGSGQPFGGTGQYSTMRIEEFKP